MVGFCHRQHARVPATKSKANIAKGTGANRENHMKTELKGLSLGLALSLTAGAAEAEGTLALYNWGDYINPEILQKFTEETGIAVTLDT